MLAHRLVSMPPTQMGEWLVKGSIFRNESICIVAYHKVADEVKIKYFLDEEAAFDYVQTFK